MNINAKDVARLDDLIVQNEDGCRARQNLYVTGLKNGATQLISYFKRGCQLADEYVQQIRDAYENNTLRLRV